MWSPTHVQVLVKRARGLNVKGKNGSNDAFVTIGLGKEKFQTSVQEKCVEPEWCEQCELTIPEQGNRAEVVLKVLHRNFLGGDDFLGQVSLPLQDYDVYEKPRAGWYPLLCKPGQKKIEYRGELEVKVGFTVRASESMGGSVTDLSKKNKGSISSLNKVAGNIGGSLLSLGGKEKKNLKSLAASVSKRVEKAGGKARRSVSSLKLQGRDKAGLASLPESSQWADNQDPGVCSEEEDDMFQFDTLSHRSSLSSLAGCKLGMVSGISTPGKGSMDSLAIQQEWGAKLLADKTVGTHVTPANDDTVSMSSIISSGSHHPATQATTLETIMDNMEETKENMGSLSSLPSYNEAMKRNYTKEEKNKKNEAKDKVTKKKIIPVVSDSSESSPSPEEPSTPVDSPQPSSISSRFRMSQRSTVSLQGEDTMQSLGQKLKNSYSFREKQDGKFNRRSSVESVSSQGPPHGTRVVLGRETSPAPSPQPCRIPREIMDRFTGQTREDLIETVVKLQARVEEQGKKVADLEDYVDGLLIKVMEASPVLLEKNLLSCKPTK
jgi:Rab11 family-interacting protein 1/2/5